MERDRKNKVCNGGESITYNDTGKELGELSAVCKVWNHRSSNTVISYVIYIVSLLVLQKNSLFETTDYLLAQILGFLLSVLWSFYWNRKYVFDADQGQVPWLQALWKTYVSYAFTGLFLNTVLSMLWVELLGISKVIAPIFNIVINVPINFLMNKFWAFKKK